MGMRKLSTQWLCFRNGARCAAVWVTCPATCMYWVSSRIRFEIARLDGDVTGRPVGFPSTDVRIADAASFWALCLCFTTRPKMGHLSRKSACDVIVRSEALWHRDNARPHVATDFKQPIAPALFLGREAFRLPAVQISAK